MGVKAAAASSVRPTTEVKMLVRTLFTLATVALLGSGCHAKFKKNASELGAVHAQTIVTTGPYVQLGMIHDDSILAAVVNVVQTVKSADVAFRLADAVQIDGVNAAFTRGLGETLGGGPPFAYSEDSTTPVLQVEVLGYGLDVPALGAAGMFTYNLRVRIYDTSGERVYKVLHSCATGVGSPDPAAQVLMVVNNLDELRAMTDEEIQSAFEASAYYCGVDLVARMRKHAG
jgi:hypothetical protein